MKNVIIFGLVLLLCSCQKEISNDKDVVASNYNLKISLNHVVGTQSLALGSTYNNPFSEAYTPTAFKYYLSNFTLQQNNEPAVAVPGIYHLVDEAVPASKSFTFALPKGKFNRLTFLVGVDEPRNTSGTQSGDLDPAKGMFWTWNSGYIMAKLEATSPVSTAAANKVELHVGGFKEGESSLRLVTFNLDAGNSIDIVPNGTSEVVLEADINTWFKRVHELKIADNPVSTSPGPVSMRFADNYAGMFKITSVKN